MYIYIFTYIYINIYSYLYLYLYLFIYLSIYLFIYLRIHVSVSAECKEQPTTKKQHAGFMEIHVRLTWLSVIIFCWLVVSSPFSDFTWSCWFPVIWYAMTTWVVWYDTLYAYMLSMVLEEMYLFGTWTTAPWKDKYAGNNEPTECVIILFSIGSRRRTHRLFFEPEGSQIWWSLPWYISGIQIHLIFEACISRFWDLQVHRFLRFIFI